MKLFNIPEPLEAKCRLLGDLLGAYDRVAVAFSGGADSSFLAWYLLHGLGKKVLAVLVESAFTSRTERENALRVAEELGLQLARIAIDPLSVPDIRNNPVDRCYHCKKAIFRRILESSGAREYAAVVDGSHAEDDRGYRPGKRALAELGILSPLALAGFAKNDIRTLSRLAGLSTSDKPSQSCLATRVPYDTPLSRELLLRIEAAEDLLHNIGCLQVRVRCHGKLARIEAEPSRFAEILTRTDEIILRLKELGFSHITLDLEGFRSGSWDKDMEKGEQAD